MESTSSAIRPLLEDPRGRSVQPAPANADVDLRTPTVSVVVVGRSLEQTSRCLQAIAATAHEIRTEQVVVIADSNDELANYLVGHPSVFVERVPRSLSLVQATNIGVSRTGADLIALVDEGADVHSGWLQSLMGLLDVWPHCGIGGGRVDNADGSIAEAGRIIWNDGSVHRSGASAGVGDHRFAHAREVDAVGGDVVLVRREVWERGPGLDESFESVDQALVSLAFAARAGGGSVMYQPARVATRSHVSTAFDSALPRGEADRLQLVNRWTSALAEQPALPDQPAQVIRHLDRRQQDRVLVVSGGMSAFDYRRRASRVLSLVGSLLRQDFAVSVVMPGDPGNGSVEVLRQIGVEVSIAPHAPRLAIEERVPELCAAIVSGPDVANEYLPMLAAVAPTVPVAYDLAEFRSLGFAHSLQGGTAPGRREHVLSEFERAALRSADLVIAGSEAQAAVVGQIESATETMVFPDLYSVPRSEAAWSARRGLVVVADDSTVAHDGLVWLLLDVMPRVWAQEPTVDLHIVGVDPSPDLTKLLDSRVHTHGSGVDVDALHDQVIASVIPSFEWADGHDSAIEAAVRGLPVITTTCGAPDPRNGVLVADAADDFASIIVRLHRDDRCWEAAARSMVKEFRLRFGPGSIDWAVADCLARLGAHGTHHSLVSHGVGAAHFVR